MNELPVHCVITGPRGSGRSYCLDLLAAELSPAETLRLSAADDDWQDALATVRARTSCRVLVDDIDRFDERFRGALYSAVKEQNHFLAATLTTFEGRIARAWEARLGPAGVIQLQAINERPADVSAFLPIWAKRLGEDFPPDATFDETAKLIVHLDWQFGFNDVVAVLQDLVDHGVRFWDPPEALALLAAHRRIVLGRTGTRAIILVEGRTDVIYLEWVSVLAIGTPPQDVDLQACNSASNVPAELFRHRNEGRESVALFDNDGKGRAVNKQVREFGLLAVVIPEKYDPLSGCGADHVHQVVEIEDLLPIDDLDRFLRETRRVPELVIEAPRKGLKRVVIHADDKIQLARWVRAHLGVDSGGRILELYNQLRERLRLPALAFSDRPPAA